MGIGDCLIPIAQSRYPGAMPTRIAIAGARGRVGQVMLSELGRDPDLTVVGGFGRADADAELDRLLPQADVLIDFTTAEAAPSMLLRAARAGVRPISGTTGLTPETLSELDSELMEQGLAGVWASNFAIGAALMIHFARIAARFMDAVESHRAPPRPQSRRPLGHGRLDRPRHSPGARARPARPAGHALDARGGPWRRGGRRAHPQRAPARAWSPIRR